MLSAICCKLPCLCCLVCDSVCLFVLRVFGFYLESKVGAHACCLLCVCVFVCCIVCLRTIVVFVFFVILRCVWVVKRTYVYVCMCVHACVFMCLGCGFVVRFVCVYFYYMCWCVVWGTCVLFSFVLIMFCFV